MKLAELLSYLKAAMKHPARREITEEDRAEHRRFLGNWVIEPKQVVFEIVEADGTCNASYSIDSVTIKDDFVVLTSIQPRKVTSRSRRAVD